MSIIIVFCANYPESHGTMDVKTTCNFGIFLMFFHADVADSIQSRFWSNSCILKVKHINIYLRVSDVKL